MTNDAQVLANILANAVKFTPSGEVVIHASCKPATLQEGGGVSGKQLVRVSIRDTGIGISEDSMKKLFQCFRQGSESMSRRYGGTGSSPSHLWYLLDCACFEHVQILLLHAAASPAALQGLPGRAFAVVGSGHRVAWHS